MSSRPSTIAFIPVRGGSKGIPRKNIRPMAGKPLLLWTLEAAAACPLIDRVVVSTDDDEIATVARNSGLPRVVVHCRHPDTATDTASTESAMLEYAEAQDFDLMVLIQATSPLLTSDDLTGGLTKYRESRADTLVSVARLKRFLWEVHADGTARPLNYDPTTRPRRQDFAGTLVENGAFYITPRAGLVAHRSRLYGRTVAWEMPEETFLELDEPSDWGQIEALLLARRAAHPTPLQNIRLFLTDVDGVLTDAGMYYSENGDELKKFNTRDAVGLRLLRERGIRVGILTGETTRLVQRRAAKMGVDYLYQGCHDKTIAFREILRELGLQPHQVAYIGDDENDRGLLALVGLAAMPQDGHPSLRPLVHVVTRAPGGGGAVRELADRILDAQARR